MYHRNGLDMAYQWAAMAGNAQLYAKDHLDTATELGISMRHARL